MFYTHLETPIGPFLLAGTGEALAMTSFSTGRQHREPDAGWVEDPERLVFAIRQIEEYFQGRRKEFDLPLEIRGTVFQKDVWNALRTIPFGETRSYGEIARALSKPGASRAVGAANAANVLPIIIPCHRVIGADHGLTGFGGGLDTKRWLLDFEGALPAEQRPLF